MKKYKIGLIASVAFEAGDILENIKNAKKVREGFFTGILFGKKIVLAISGIGKTNAAHTATLLVEKYAPALIINFGIGGAYPASGLKIGNIAIANKEIYGDEGVLVKDGFSDMRMTGIPLLKKGRKKYFNEFTLDRDSVKTAISASKLFTHHASRITGVRSGSFVTVSTCTGTIKRALELEKRYQAICENMEGAAIAHICAMHDIPMIEIRGISNIVENRDTKKWDIKLAAGNCQKAVMVILNRVST